MERKKGGRKGKKRIEKLKWEDKRENHRLKRGWGKEWLRVRDKGR